MPVIFTVTFESNLYSTLPLSTMSPDRTVVTFEEPPPEPKQLIPWEIIAPFSKVILLALVSLSAYLTPSSPLLLTVMLLAPSSGTLAFSPTIFSEAFTELLIELHPLLATSKRLMLVSFLNFPSNPLDFKFDKPVTAPVTYI